MIFERGILIENIEPASAQPLQMETRAIPFNVNLHVRVKLTELGREICRERHRRLCEALTARGARFRPPGDGVPEETAGGWSRWQLWALMDYFGAHCGLGRPVPFETEIEILVEEEAVP